MILAVGGVLTTQMVRSPIPLAPKGSVAVAVIVCGPKAQLEAVQVRRVPTPVASPFAVQSSPSMSEEKTSLEEKSAYPQLRGGAR